EQRQSRQNERGADQSCLRDGFHVIVVRMVNPKVAGKALIGGISRLKISQAHAEDGMIAQHAERIQSPTLAPAIHRGGAGNLEDATQAPGGPARVDPVNQQGGGQEGKCGCRRRGLSYGTGKRAVATSFSTSHGTGKRAVATSFST